MGLPRMGSKTLFVPAFIRVLLPAARTAEAILGEVMVWFYRSTGIILKIP
jgi:hypothetical protein